MRTPAALFILVAIVLSLTGMARADDWTAVRLRGQVVQMIDNQWQPLKRGAVVPDSRVVRTLANGHVTLQRGNETVALSENTQIRIFDRPGRTARKPFTTVEQDFGTVAVEAEVEQVQHFAVQTPYVAAVVKGTRFIVVQGKSSASVSVQRGHVLVEDRGTKDRVTISVGQSATVDPKAHGVMAVTGKGKLPAVTDRHDKVVSVDAGTPAGNAGSSGHGNAGNAGAAAGSSGSSGYGGGYGKGGSGYGGYHGGGHDGYGKGGGYDYGGYGKGGGGYDNNGYGGGSGGRGKGKGPR